MALDWGTILGTTSAAASGGIFGVVGSLLGGIFKAYQKKQEHRQQLEMMEMQMKIKSQEGSWSGLTASIAADTSISANVHTWVNDLRGLYRPFLTTCLVAGSVYVFFMLLSALTDKTAALAQLLTVDEIKAMLRYDVYTIVFLTGTSVGWWFGDRSIQPPNSVMR